MPLVGASGPSVAFDPHGARGHLGADAVLLVFLGFLEKQQMQESIHWQQGAGAGVWRSGGVSWRPGGLSGALVAPWAAVGPFEGPWGRWRASGPPAGRPRAPGGRVLGVGEWRREGLSARRFGIDPHEMRVWSDHGPLFDPHCWRGVGVSRGAGRRFRPVPSGEGWVSRRSDPHDMRVRPDTGPSRSAGLSRGRRRLWAVWACLGGVSSLLPWIVGG